MTIKQPCVLKISAVQEQMELRKVLIQIATERIATEKVVCTIVEDQADQIPKLRDMDAEAPPSTGMAIRWDSGTQPQGELIAEWFENIGFIVHRGSALPSKSASTEIWIDIGSGYLWRQ
jgi:hypothetical protein